MQIQRRKKMKIRRASLLLLSTAAAFFIVGSVVGGSGASVSNGTTQNLSTAMHGEAFAYAKYMLYAEHARQQGNTELANLFETAAKTERLEHFAEEARLAGLAGSDAKNLEDAIRGESYEADTMYREFAEQARAAGDQAAASRFEEVRHDEMTHRDAFKAALAKVNATTAEK
jgi:rubrerythrin